MTPPAPGARTVLVTGFGPFLDVADNPSSAIAAAVDGHRVGGVRVVGLPHLPVSYERAVAETVAAADREGAVAVVGFGVARGAMAPRVEDIASNRLDPSLTDVDGVSRAAVVDAADAPGRLPLSGPAARLASALGIAVNPLHDAGGYVCNAWMYGVGLELGGRMDVCFVHVPAAGIDPGRVLDAVAAVWGISA